MTDRWDKIVDDIKQDVGIIANKIARGAARIALQDLQEAHSSIMDEYYGGYTPVSSYYYYNKVYGKVWAGQAHGYRRTGNLRNNSIIPQQIYPVGRHGFSAQILVGAMNMDDYINSTGRVFPASKVFDYMWNYGTRGLPPGNIGHIEEFSINVFPVGVQISGSPHEAMSEFVNTWGDQRGRQVADSVAHSV